MPDLIRLQGMRVLAFCGALPEEQERRQPFEIDVDIETDLTTAGRSDELEDTIDYGAVGESIAAVAADGRFTLMERFADAIASSVLAERTAAAVTVEVRKTRPPVAEDLRSSAVRITRRA